MDISCTIKTSCGYKQINEVCKVTFHFEANYSPNIAVSELNLPTIGIWFLGNKPSLLYAILNPAMVNNPNPELHGKLIFSAFKFPTNLTNETN